ncbi:MAG: aminodeoxychorismate synthase component I [Pseudomonadales bacterium]|nr:aminodeoxychorismate synthase component I [Pseudomonadales bacterium]
MPLHQLDLPYHPDSAVLFEKIHHLPGAVFLDSCAHRNDQGRYDILAALPYLQLEGFSNHTLVTSQGQTEKHSQAPFDVFKSILIQENKKHNNEKLNNLPFSGGAIGHFNYELNHPSLIKKKLAPDKILMQAGFYDVFIIVDHQKQHCIAYSINENTNIKLQQLQKFIEQPAATDSFQLQSPFKKNISAKRYKKDFSSIQEFILNGDCYQINYTQRFETHYSGNPWLAYKALRQKSPAPFSAYINSKKHTVLCHSPEQFLQLKENHITSKPIKGTRARKVDIKADNKEKNTLINSKKDQAENLMIVDLIRNDIGRNAEVGSVKVPQLFALESFANVHHLVSTITAELAENRHAVDLFQHSFPGGSITGAPKIRAMEIINELEEVERDIYCGSIAYFSFNGNMDSNITIRTILCEHNQNNSGNIYCWGGGGIVADSKEEEEYQESIDKVSNLLQELERVFIKTKSH